MRTSRLLLHFSTVSLAIALSFSPVAEEAHAIGPRDRHLTSLRHGIAVEAPAGWALSQHTGYGDTVVLLLHPDGSRISVSAADTTAENTSQLYEQNRKGLIAQKLAPAPPQPGPRGFLSVDIATSERPERLRQLYLVRPVPSGKQAVILTLVARTTTFTVHVNALDFVANRMSLDDPVPPAAAAKIQSTPVPKLALSEAMASSGAGGAGGAPPAEPPKANGRSAGQVGTDHR